MKIVHVTEPFSGGIVTFLVYQTDYMPEYEHVIIHGRRTTADEEENVKSKFKEYVTFLKWKYAHREVNPIKDILSIFSLIKLLKIIDADIVHLHSSKAGFAGRIASLFFKKKAFIYTPHSPAFDRKDIGFIKRGIFLTIEKMLFKLSSKIICCSESEYHLLKKKGIDSIYINNSVSINDDGFPKNNNILTIGFAGIITHQKRPEWFNTIAQNFVGNDNIKFIWIGDGPLREKINSPNVRIYGWRSSGEVKELLEGIDIFMSCAAWEGLPYAVLEALERSKPLLLSNIPAHHVLVENSNGWLFNSPKEGIKRITKILEKKETLTSPAKKSRELAIKNFNIKMNIEKYKHYYETISTP